MVCMGLMIDGGDGYGIARLTDSGVRPRRGWPVGRVGDGDFPDGTEPKPIVATDLGDTTKLNHPTPDTSPDIGDRGSPENRVAYQNGTTTRRGNRARAYGLDTVPT